MSETLTIPGTVKRIRALKDLVYKGQTFSGRRSVRIDGKAGDYEVKPIPGQELEVDQYFAREAVTTGKAELLAGGLCEVVVEKDGFHRYSDWRPEFRSAKPDYQRVEFLKAGGWPGGLSWGAGFKCRIDLALLFPGGLGMCYEDETPTDRHHVRVLAPSPKRVKMDATEQAGKVNAIFDKLFPAAV